MNTAAQSTGSIIFFLIVCFCQNAFAIDLADEDLDLYIHAKMTEIAKRFCDPPPKEIVVTGNFEMSVGVATGNVTIQATYAGDEYCQVNSTAVQQKITTGAN